MVTISYAPSRRAYQTGVGARWSPDGALLASLGASTEGIVRLWRPDGTPVATLGPSDPSAPEVPFVMAWRPDGQALVIGFTRGTLEVWSRDGRRVDRQRGHAEAVYALAWSPDGALLATGSRDATVRLWSMGRP